MNSDDKTAHNDFAPLSELNDAELDKVSGGCSCKTPSKPWIVIADAPIGGFDNPAICGMICLPDDM
jgi:hypothetical protein